MNKIKSHKGLLKRIKVTRNGKVKHQPAGARHRKSLNSQRQNRQLRHEKVAPKVEARRIYQALHLKTRWSRPEATVEQAAE